MGGDAGRAKHGEEGRERKKVMREGGREGRREGEEQTSGFSSPAEGPDTPMTY